MLLPTLVRMGNLSLPSRSVQGLEIGTLGYHDAALQYIVIHVIGFINASKLQLWLLVRQT